MNKNFEKWYPAIKKIVEYGQGKRLLVPSDVLESIQTANLYRNMGSDIFDAVALFHELQKEHEKNINKIKQ